MGWLANLFGRSDHNETEVELPVGMDGDLGSDEGGLGPFAKEIAGFRWVAGKEAVATARREIDPELWADGRPSFEFERALAHGHESLRDRLSAYVGGKIRDSVVELFEKIGDIASIRAELAETDDDLISMTRDWKRLYGRVRFDDLELGRYYRLNSWPTRLVKWFLLFMFIAVEWFAAGAAFDNALPPVIPFAGFVFSLGLMIMLVAIPHYTALGLKEGLTAYHSFEHRAKVETGEPSVRLARLKHQEEQDDRVFRWISAALAVLLLAMIVPLSYIRAAEAGDGENQLLWWAFFALLQIGISGYFFLREWLDHGTTSANLHKLGQQKELLEGQRSDLIQDLVYETAEYHVVAEDLLFYLRECPRWDSYIVESYLETSHYFRHVIAVERADLDPFITWASMPYLGSRAEAELSEYPLQALSEEHAALEADSLRGRTWLMDQISEALADDALEELDLEDGERVDVANWLLTKSPSVLLAQFLDRYFDLDATYRPHKDLAPLDDEAPFLVGDLEALVDDVGVADEAEPEDEIETEKAPVGILEPNPANDEDSSEDEAVDEAQSGA